MTFRENWGLRLESHIESFGYLEKRFNQHLLVRKAFSGCAQR